MELIDTITLLFMRYGYHVKNKLNSCHAIFKYTYGFLPAIKFFYETTAGINIRLNVKSNLFLNE